MLVYYSHSLQSWGIALHSVVSSYESGRVTFCLAPPIGSAHWKQ